MKKISVIIPSYNSLRTVGQTLASIESQTKRTSVIDIIVVDSSDDEETKAHLKSLKIPKMKVIEAGNKVMPARARNIGAELSQGEILVFIDSDAYMAPDWIEIILRQSELGRRIGGGSILLPETQKFQWIPTAQYFLQFNEYMDIGPARVKPFLPSCNMFCDRSLFFRAGGFPEMRASEDVLFFLKAGIHEKIWFIPEAKVYHIFRESLSSMLSNQRLLGKYVLIYRRLAEKTRFYYRGSWPFLFLPVFMMIKFFRIAKRLFRSRREHMIHFAFSSPAFFLGFMFWGIGFAEGGLE